MAEVPVLQPVASRIKNLVGCTRARELAAVFRFLLAITLAFVTGVFAQEPLLQSGEAYATRFSVPL